ncbi:MAG TPA: tripartite tricarboxylate transporter substrate-binding protein [Thermomicrobiales bacterium]|nr:tripartite tricarboxylate transporter substrate-binding protein [Thermomicrobiales bacterium]
MLSSRAKRHPRPLRAMLFALMALALGVTAFVPGTAVAQDDCADWSSETLQIMAPASPGGGWDGTARELQTALQDEGIVNTVEVFNVPGAAGTIGLAELVNEHSGDSHMAMVMGLVMVGGIGLNESPVTLEQVTPIARLTTEWEVIVVPADSPYQTIDDLMEAFKADPGAVSWAGGSAGGTDHLLVGMLAQAEGIDPTLINYVPFSGGGEALSAILGGQTTAGVSGLGEWQAQIESGDLRALAVSGRTEAGSATPEAGGATPAASFGADIPTLQESGIDVELANWRGVVAPPELDEAEAACLSGAFDQVVHSATWQATLQRFGWSDFYQGSEEFGGYIASETEHVNQLLTDLGLIGG